ncbi:hypothetical protein HELRODRAFT_90768 [Helobdella robusta]|uniref:Cyclin-like domain-containing protein n=1 Tax=Helobdella robusta TaxID=6412 RepID=T1G7V9_HELRO|nr:hypothetical protein HELRODRAFT_90768 [Helobdella robusta]ESN90828.1 hypothetical protein HELRODRAFT_90768 [Helobdella robusta]
MFTLSTQLRCWTFASADELEELRRETREAFIKKQEDSIQDSSIFLSYEEECQLRRYYEGKLKRFCQRFQPQMPNYVLGTAMAYFKRIYLHNSIMEPTPEDFMYTCVYLACKVEEFNLTMQQFISNLDEDQSREKSRILAKELRVMEMVHYHLTVHNPYRALEGLLIDVKTRCTDIAETEKLRPFFDQFFNKSVLTDACLLFPPSQIALAAMITSATNLGLNAALDRLVGWLSE